MLPTPWLRSRGTMRGDDMSKRKQILTGTLTLRRSDVEKIRQWIEEASDEELDMLGLRRKSNRPVPVKNGSEPK